MKWNRDKKNQNNRKGEGRLKKSTQPRKKRAAKQKLKKGDVNIRLGRKSPIGANCDCR